MPHTDPQPTLPPAAAFAHVIAEQLERDDLCALAAIDNAGMIHVITFEGKRFLVTVKCL